jgi:hypothetical protein
MSSQAAQPPPMEEKERSRSPSPPRGRNRKRGSSRSYSRSRSRSPPRRRSRSPPGRPRRRSRSRSWSGSRSPSPRVCNCDCNRNRSCTRRVAGVFTMEVGELTAMLFVCHPRIVRREDDSIAIEEVLAVGSGIVDPPLDRDMDLRRTFVATFLGEVRLWTFMRRICRLRPWLQ